SSIRLAPRSTLFPYTTLFRSFTGILLLPGLVMWARRRRPRGAALVLLWPIAFWAYAIALYPRHFSLSRYTIPLMPALALVAMGPDRKSTRLNSSHVSISYAVF